MCHVDTFCKPEPIVHLADNAIPYAGEVFEIGWNRWQQTPVYSWHNTPDVVLALTVSLLPFFFRSLSDTYAIILANADSLDLQELIAVLYADVSEVLELLRSRDA
jgi:hypothetical protein